jgi:hypothetical protein
MVLGQVVFKILKFNYFPYWLYPGPFWAFFVYVKMTKFHNSQIPYRKDPALGLLTIYPAAQGKLIKLQTTRA